MYITDRTVKPIINTNSPTFVLEVTGSLQMRHFFTLAAQTEQAATWPHGANRVSLELSEHTIHSVRLSLPSPSWLI